MYLLSILIFLLFLQVYLPKIIQGILVPFKCANTMATTASVDPKEHLTHDQVREVSLKFKALDLQVEQLLQKKIKYHHSK